MKALLRFGPFMVLTLAMIVLSTDLRGGEKDKDKKPEDVTVNDSLTAGDLKDKKRAGSYCKTYTFKMTKGARYQLDMKSKEFDSYLRLEDPKGNEVAFDDDSGGFPDARIIYQANETGDFTIICTTFSGGSTGKYALFVKYLDGK